MAYIIGDLHAGSRYALPVVPELDDCWQNLRQRMERDAKTHDILLMLGGDLVEGQQWRTQSSVGNAKDQRDIAIELLAPLARLARWRCGCLGTEAHAGDGSSDDAQVYEELGVDYYWNAAIRLGDWVIDHAHHGVGVSINRRNEANGLVEKAKRMRENGGGATHVIRHHAHRSPEPIYHSGMWLAVCPCWQLSTPYGHKVADGLTTDIGYLTIASDGRIVRHLYSIDKRRVIQYGAKG